MQADSQLLIGTTSAHAENTRHRKGRRKVAGNYLRARGEYIISTVKSQLQSELPPRTRRILLSIPFILPPVGTTSAHAENTLNELGLL